MHVIPVCVIVPCFIKEGEKIENLAKNNVVINIPFLQEKSVTQRDDMLHTIDGPMPMLLIYNSLVNQQWLQNIALFALIFFLLKLIGMV